ncbi:MAG: TIGR02452 family protein, partial [Clostridia bacterium]|nr:TIGR02452 family protein [Clostridia bacterium]
MEHEGIVKVTRQRTFEAAIEIHCRKPQDRIAVLNFASAVNPGGGVKHGARAQEESLCRCSNLYPVLNQQKNWDRYYKVNRQAGNPHYTDAIMYSPEIRIIKTDDGLYQRLPEDEFVSTDVITCAAPNLNPYAHAEHGFDRNRFMLGSEEQTALHRSRARHILSVAAAHDVDTLILGAFGCGAFSNDPKAVARAYAEVLQEYRYSFREIEFAVYCS